MPSQAEKIIGLYQRNAENWDKDRGRDLFEKPWLDRFMGLLSAGASILDVGCGGAEPISRYFIESGFDVSGIDSSPSLIEICRKRFPGNNWIVGDMRTLALDQCFDGLLAWDSFFHLCPEDQRLMFTIFREHSNPMAALMFTSGPQHGEAMGAYHGEPLYHASLSEAEYKSLLRENGYEVVSHVVKDASCGHHTIWLAQLQ